jgi:hypothetical protein
MHFEGEEGLTPKLYQRTYQAKGGKERKRYYAVFTDWSGGGDRCRYQRREKWLLNPRKVLASLTGFEAVLPA